MRNLLVIATAMLVCLGVIATNSDRAVAASKTTPLIPFVGFDDNRGMYNYPDADQPAETVQMAQAAGMDAEEIYMTWSPFRTVTAQDKHLLCNAAIQASLAGFKAFMFTMTPVRDAYPLPEPQLPKQEQPVYEYWAAMDAYFAALFDPTTGCVSGNYVLPDGQHVPKLAQLWVSPTNESNLDTFCTPQTDTSHDLCASLAVYLRSIVYPLIKQAGIQFGVNMTVVGCELSSHHDPFGYLAAERKAMVTEHVTSANMDVCGFHPYSLSGASNPFSGMLMYPKLLEALKKTYGRAPPVVYSEMAFQTTVPSTVDSCDNQPSFNTFDNSKRAWLYKLALDLARKQGVIGVVFYQLVDDQCQNGGWRAGFYYWNGQPKPLLGELKQTIQGAEAQKANVRTT